MERHRYLDEAQLKVVADPLRQRILAELCRGERTTTDLAERLTDVPSNLYHHVARLEEVGLIELVRMEARRGATAKYYRAVARRFSAAPDLLAELGPGEEGGVVEAVGGAIRAALDELKEAVAAGLLSSSRRGLLVTRLRVRGDARRMESLRLRLEAVVEELAEEYASGEVGLDGDAVEEHTMLLTFFRVPG